MKPERWERIESLFSRAIELPAAERTAFLDRECEGDAELRDEVDTLLVEHGREPGPLDAERPWLPADRGEDEPTDAPAAIGPYRIVRELGRGGMGQVFLAEREAPGFRQLVALKVMRRGLDTDDLVARFRNERQILARLSHPNIARLFDVGATERGLPYYVMEYIDGIPIRDFCDRRRLTVRERLHLFRTVCDAVHHAHRNLIVHRDLKPHNILVGDDGAPKLLDFGIAKILDQDGHDGSQQATQVNVRVLTPEYSAPEQIRGDPVTTACDVYALGILLYELLAGRHPYGMPLSRGAELERRVLEVDPPPPSAAPAPRGSDPESIAAARRTTVSQLRRRLAGDLDTIVLKALRKEPEARYPSALSLAEDVGRHLEGRPVDARPVSARYRLGKFVARNRLMVAAGAGLALVLLASSVVTLYQSARIREESARVARERDKALEVRSFLLETFGATGPDQAAGDTVTARQLLDRRADGLAVAYPNDPELRAEMTHVLAEGYEKLGLFEQAETLARQALDLRRSLFGGAHPDVAVSLNLVGWILRERGDLNGAEARLREAVEVGRGVFPPHGDPRLARALNDLGAIRDAQGAYAEAAALYEESIDMRRRALGDEHIGVAIASSNLAVTRYYLGDYAAAVRAGRDALDLFLRILGPDHQRTAMAQTNLAAMQSALGDHEAAVELHREIVERRRRLFGPRHASVAVSLTLLGNDLNRLGRPAEAAPLLEEAVDIQSEGSGVRLDDAANTLRVLGVVLNDLGRHADAIPHLTRALDMRRTLTGDAHEQTAILHNVRAVAHEGVGDLEAAERDFRDAAAVAALALRPDHSLAIAYRLALVEFLTRRGRRDEAMDHLADAERALDSAGADPDHPQRQRAGRARSALES